MNKLLSKYNKDLIYLLLIEAVYLIFAGFMGFVNYKVWEKVDGDFSLFLVYFLFYFAVRATTFVIANLLCLKVNTTKVLKMALYILLSAPIIYIFILDRIDNIYLWFLVLNIPNGSVISFYSCSYNLLLSHVGKKHKIKKYSGFFSIKVFIGSMIGFLLPLMFGFIIDGYGFNIVSIVLLIITLISIYFSKKLPNIKVELGFNSYKEVLKGVKANKNKRKKERKKLMLIHTIYLLLTGYMFQYLDMFKTLMKFEISSDNTQLGIISALIFVANTISVFIFNKNFIKKESWFLVGSIMIVGSLASAYLLENVNLLIVLLIYSTGIYFFNVLISSVTFDLMDDFTDGERYIMLFKREFVNMMAKTLFVVIALISGVKTFSDHSFLILGIVFVILTIIANILYLTLNKEKKES